MAVTRKTRAARWGGALLVALAPLPWLGFGSAQAADSAVYATVTDHEAFSSDANQADYWGDDCEKIIDGGSLSSYVLTRDYALVIVKAGAGNVDPYTNTLFADASRGETVWADTNGNSSYDPGGQGGDKTISHIIVCGSTDPYSSKPVTSKPPTTKPPVTETQTTTKPPTTKPPVTETQTTTKPPTTKPPVTETQTTTKPPTTKPPVTETQTTGSASPSSSSGAPSSSSGAPSSSSGAPSSSSGAPSSSSGAPSTSISTEESGQKPTSSSPEVTEIETSAGALPKTGSDVPWAGAVGISLLLIGLGALLLLGPGRLIPASYHRKH
jgi:LPXTG-motif cell wall-anchored protein